MTLETFFEKFDLFADAPEAVERMRELVLDLAASGRLMPRNGEWETRSLKSLATKIGSGATPAGGRESYFSKGIPLIRSMNVHFRGFDRTGLVFLSDDQADKLSYVTVQPNDVLLNITGASIGRVTIAPDDLAGARVNQHVTIIRPRSELLPRFLSTFLASPSVQTMINDIQVGATRQALTKGMIEQFEIPVPPLAEQKRVVAKVDELMALCDRLEAQQSEREAQQAALARASLARFSEAPTPANLNFLFHKSSDIPPADLRKSILTLAVQGKLVPQYPNDEPVEDSFPKLAAAAVQSEDDDFPAHWLRVPLGKMGDWRGGGTPSKSRPEFWKGDLPWVSPKDMKVLHIADAQDHISPAAVEGSSVRLIPSGSLLMVVRGMILARAFPVALTTREVTINQDMKALLPFEPRTKGYILTALRAFEPDVLVAIEHSSHGTCKLKTDFLQDFVIPIPPLAEQRRIVAKVDELMALVDALETQLATARATASNLLSALVAELTAASGHCTSRPKVVPFHSTPELIKASLAAEVVERMHGHESFGQTKLQKVLYLTEYLQELPGINSLPRRFARGPHDPALISQVEYNMKEREWFEPVRREGREGWKYKALAKAGEHRPVFEEQWGDKTNAIRRLIDMMKTWPTERCERFATLYAAWNDLIHWKKPATDDAILREVWENWHPHKQQIAREKWHETLNWMRGEGHIPIGFGRATQPEPQAEMLF